MKSYEEWNALREEHLKKAREHFEISKHALQEFIETHNFMYFEIHMKEYKIHNKHWGIAQAMWTRRYGKL